MERILEIFTRRNGGNEDFSSEIFHLEMARFNDNQR